MIGAVMEHLLLNGQPSETPVLHLLPRIKFGTSRRCSAGDRYKKGQRQDRERGRATGGNRAWMGRWEPSTKMEMFDGAKWKEWDGPISGPVTGHWDRQWSEQSEDARRGRAGWFGLDR